VDLKRESEVGLIGEFVERLLSGGVCGFVTENSLVAIVIHQKRIIKILSKSKRDSLGYRHLLLISHYYCPGGGRTPFIRYKILFYPEDKSFL
jgi:hypothetical protein